MPDRSYRVEPSALARSVDLAASFGVAPVGGTIVIGGRSWPVFGAPVQSFARGDVCAPPVTDWSERRVWPHAIVIHTSEGQPHKPAIVEAPRAPSRACRLTRYQTSTDREVSWDFLVGQYGVIYQQNDPVARYTWQAGVVNGHTLGIELEQGPDGELVRTQLDVLVALVDTLTRALSIQRQLPAVLGRDAAGALVRMPDPRVLPVFAEEASASWWGLLGHCNVTHQRSEGDPGMPVFARFLRAGYEGWDLATREDRRVWAARQAALGVATTGIPDAPTVRALAARGYPWGLWVSRPSDFVLA